MERAMINLGGNNQGHSQPEGILSACVFQGNVVEDVVHSGQKMAEEALFPVK